MFPPSAAKTMRTPRYQACDGKLAATDFEMSGSRQKGRRSGSGLRQARGRDGNDQSELAADPGARRSQH